MKIVFFGNNRLACNVLERLETMDTRVVAGVVHPDETRRAGDALLDRLKTLCEDVHPYDRLREQGFDDLFSDAPDLGLAVNFGYVLPSELLDRFPRGVINLHLGYLPYNRGAYPNVWSIVEGTPAGVTLHFMDEDVDTGDIIARRSVEVRPVDTGATLYDRLQDAAVALFEDRWPEVETGTVEASPQEPAEGTRHRVDDVEEIDEIDRDAMVRAGDLIDRIRARSFPPYPGTYFVHEGRRVYLRLELLDEDQLGQTGTTEDDETS